MPFIIADRVRETSATTGTGSITLDGAATGYQTFDAVLDTGDTTYYTIAEQNGPNWEVGIGTFTAPATLARTTILSSSAGGNIVTFNAGTKDVFISLPASRTNVEDQPNLIEVNSSSTALRITQTGTGNALLVEDSANPDSSPFVVDASGFLITGATTNQAANLATGNARVQILGGTAPLALYRDADSSTAINLEFAKRRSTGGLLANGDVIGRLYFSGNDGTAAIPAAFIDAAVDGTPGTNDMPGRLVFSTTADGASTPTERMRITNAGLVGIGATPQFNLDVVGAGSQTIRARSTDTTGFTIGRVMAEFAGGSSVIEMRAGLAYTILLSANATDPLIFGAGGGTERMRITAAGNVGIGTSAPAEALTVSRPSGEAIIGVRNTGTNSAWLLMAPGSSGNAIVHNIGNTATVFTTNGTERMRIDNTGNVGIGTSSPANRLDVSGTVRATAYAGIDGGSF